MNEETKVTIDDGEGQVITVKGIQGEKGDKGDPGDTPTTDELLTLIEPLIPEPIPGKAGKDGLDGETIIGPQGERGKDGSPDSPKEIAEKLNTLKEAVDISVIKGGVTQKDLIDGIAKVDGRIKLVDQRWHGGGLSKVSTDTSLTGTGTAANPLSVNASALSTSFKTPVNAASLSNISGTYSNGTAGVGATFTVSASGDPVIDGVIFNVLGMRALFAGQSNSIQNGIYVYTTLGGGLVKGVFTRATDYDSQSKIARGDQVLSFNGTTNIYATFIQNLQITSPVGSQNISFTKNLNVGQLIVNNGIVTNGITVQNNAVVFGDLIAFGNISSLNITASNAITSQGLMTAQTNILFHDNLYNYNSQNFYYTDSLQSLSVGRGDNSHRATVEGVSINSRIIANPSAVSATLLLVNILTAPTQSGGSITPTQAPPFLGNPTAFTLTEIQADGGFYTENGTLYQGRIWSEYDPSVFSAFPSSGSSFTDNGGVANSSGSTVVEDVTASGYFENGSTYDFYIYPYYNYGSTSQSVSSTPELISVTDNGGVANSSGSTAGETGGTGYTEPFATPDVYEFYIYPYFTVNAIQYVSATPEYVTFNSGIMGATFDINFLLSTFSNVQHDGCYITRNINSGGYNDGIDINTSTNFDDNNTLWTGGLSKTALDALPNAIPFGLTITPGSLSNAQAQGYYITRQIAGGGFNDGQLFTGFSVFNDTNTGWNMTYTQGYLAGLPTAVLFNISWNWSAPVTTNRLPTGYLLGFTNGMASEVYYHTNDTLTLEYNDTTGSYPDPTPTAFYTDYLANGTTRNYKAVLYADDPDGNIYVSATPATYSFIDDNSGNLYQVQHNFDQTQIRLTGDATGNAGLTYNDHIDTIGNSILEDSSTWITGNPALPTDYGFQANGTNFQGLTYTFYNEAALGGLTIYSSGLATNPLNDPNDGFSYYVQLSVSSQSTPYKILRSGGLAGMSDAQIISSGTSPTYDLLYTSWADSPTVSPNTYLQPAGWFAKDTVDFNDSATAVMQSLNALTPNPYIDFQDSAGASMGKFGRTPNSFKFTNIPTSASGLTTGEIWNNSGVLTII